MAGIGHSRLGRVQEIPGPDRDPRLVLWLFSDSHYFRFDGVGHLVQGRLHISFLPFTIGAEAPLSSEATLFVVDFTGDSCDPAGIMM
jgi:hypothetical protein